MSEIKSSFEKAMERFKDVAPDKKSLQRKEHIDKGKLLCARVLENPQIDIEQELTAYAEQDREYVRNGLGEALLLQIALPSNDSTMSRIDTIKTIAMSLSPNPAMVEQLIKQFHSVCQQYLEEHAKFAQQMQTQLAQITQQASGNPAQQQTLQARVLQAAQEQRKELQNHFDPAVKKVRNHLRQLCGFALER